MAVVLTSAFMNLYSLNFTSKGSDILNYQVKSDAQRRFIWYVVTKPNKDLPPTITPEQLYSSAIADATIARRERTAIAAASRMRYA
jgi:hypothetical protein